MSLPTVVFLVPAAVCALAWLGAGSWIPARWRPQDALLDALTAAAAGIGVVQLAVLALGLAGALDRWVVVVATCALAVPGAVRLRALLRRASLPRDRGVRVLLGVVALALALDLVASAVPPTSPDALKYHLTLPERWLATGSIDAPFYLWEGFSPSAVETLFAQGLAFAPGGEAASAIGGVLALLAGLAVFGLAREAGAGDVLAGAAGAALFLLQGLVTWEATSMFVELGLVFYTALGAWLALLAMRTRSPSAAAAWTSVAAGGAAATKYLGAPVAVLLVAGAGAALGRRLGPRRAVALVLPALLIAGPWYLRNAIETGNPVYPVAFGGEHWGADDQRELDAVGERYGVSDNPLRLALLPLDLVRHGEAYDRGRYVGIAVFAFALAALVVARTRAVTALALGALAYLALWWSGSQQARFLLPALCVLAAAGGAGFAALVRRGGIAGRGAWGVLGLAAVMWALASGALTRQLLPAALGLEARGDAVQRLTGTADAFEQAAGRVDGTLGVVEYQFTFHYPRPAIPLGSALFGPGVERDEAIAGLTRYGVTDVLAPARSESSLFATLRPCLRPLATFGARLVLSRTLGESVDYPLALYRVTCV